jgi:hypothetical protein
LIIVPKIKPSQALTPTFVDRRTLLPEASSPSTAPQAWQTKKQTDYGAHECTRHRLLAGSHSLNAHSASDQVDGQPNCTDSCNAD